MNHRSSKTTRKEVMIKKKPKPTNVANVVPSLKKAKKKGANAASRQLDADWQKMLAAHASPLERGAKSKGIEVQPPKRKKRFSKHVENVSMVPPLTVPPGRTTSHDLLSRETPGGNASRAPDKKYTGTKMLGIGQLHKSNSVPVFQEDDAVDIARMRR